ncbi:MAG: hypothetical protein R3B13_17905 [Polyangiaceae bacterium]
MTAPVLGLRGAHVVWSLLVASCGARSSASALPNPPPDGAGEAAWQDRDAGSQSDAPTAVDDGSSPPDATSADAADSGSVVSDGGPTCAEVGKHTGVSACCSGTYCAGGCVGKQPYCMCGSFVGGCPWPLVCCPAKGGGCGAESWCPR